MIKDRVEKEKGGGALRLLLLKIKCPYDEFNLRRDDEDTHHKMTPISFVIG